MCLYRYTALAATCAPAAKNSATSARNIRARKYQFDMMPGAIAGAAQLLPALRINVSNPSSCLPGGLVPPHLQSLFAESKRPTHAAYGGGALSAADSACKNIDADVEIASSRSISWSAPVMPPQSTVKQLQRWWTSGAALHELLPAENVLLKAQIEQMCGGNVANLERERQLADPFSEILASDRRIFGIPECVAYAQMDVECGFLLPAKERVFFADVCGSGAFTEFAVTRLGKAAKGWAIRSNVDDVFAPTRMNPIARALLPLNVDTKYAPSDGEGRSLTQENVRLEIIDHVLAVSGEGLDVVAASWSPECSKEKQRSIAVTCARFAAQLLTAFDLCAQGGTLLVRLFTSTDPVIIGLIPLVSSCFSSSAIIKPVALNPYSATRFLVCKGMLHRMDDSSGIRYTTSTFLALAVKKLESGDAAWLAGPSPLYTPPLASKFVGAANDNIDSFVLRMWTRAASLKNVGSAGDKGNVISSAFRSKLMNKLSVWAVPDKSLLQHKQQLQQLGFAPSEMDALTASARMGFMNTGRLAQLQASKSQDSSPQLSTQPKIAAPPPPKIAPPNSFEASVQHRPPPSSTPAAPSATAAPAAPAAPVTQARLKSSDSSSAVAVTKRKRNDAEAFLEANEIDQSKTSAQPSKPAPPNPGKTTVASRPPAASAQSTSSSTPAPKAPVKAIPAPLVAAAKAAGLSLTTSSKSTKSSHTPLISTVESPASDSNPAEIVQTSVTPIKSVAIIAEPVNHTASDKSNDLEKLQPVQHESLKVASKATSEETSSSSSKVKPCVPSRRKRIIDSDDSDSDIPAAANSSLLVAAAATDQPPAASPPSSKKPRVVILSSRAATSALASAAANPAESAAGSREVEELLASSAAANADPSASVADAVSTVQAAPVKSGLKLALKRRVSE